MDEFYIMVGILFFIILFFCGLIFYLLRMMRKRMCIVYYDGVRSQILLLSPKEGRVTIENKEYNVNGVASMPVQTGILRFYYPGVFIKQDVMNAMPLEKLYAAQKYDRPEMTATGFTDLIRSKDIHAIHDAITRANKFMLSNPVLIIGGIIGILIGFIAGILLYPHLFPPVIVETAKAVAAVAPGTVIT